MKVLSILLFGLLHCVIFPTNCNDVLQPWLGVLITKPAIGVNQPPGITNIILIAKGRAIGVADDIGRINKEHMKHNTEAIFFESLMYTYRIPVEDYIVHSEYYDGVKNTLALVFLADIRANWTWIYWPPDDTFHTPLYMFGYTERNISLEQEQATMSQHDNHKCTVFYKQHELDADMFWPQDYICVTEDHNEQSCVYDAGMALTTQVNGYWTLLGISTWGPGCVNPARFIKFYPYIEWILKVIDPKDELFRKQIDARRARPHKPDYIRQDYYNNRDEFIMSQMDKDTIKLEILPKERNESEYLNNLCPDRELVYRDKGYVTVPISDLDNMIVYSVSLYDMIKSDINCVIVKLICTKASTITIYSKQGFEQDDTEQLYQTASNRPGGYPRVLFLTDLWSIYRNIKTFTIWFKFEFPEYAELDVTIYANGIRGGNV